MPHDLVGQELKVGDEVTPAVVTSVSPNPVMKTVTPRGVEHERYPLAPQGVFLTVNGEGHFAGVPMVFVRLAGCSVGCPHCDTDYQVDRRATAREIALGAASAVTGLSRVRWVWLTGGEPCDHDLRPLLAELYSAGFNVAVATSGSGCVPLPERWEAQGLSFVSVSPHYPDDRWRLRWGQQINVVPGLNGYRLRDFAPLLEQHAGAFPHRYVTPLAGDYESATECREWVLEHPAWRLGVQAHKLWGLP